ncbi:Hsp20/alpha crystallin family protein [Paucibacter sp. PLA-PC-4]|uniref:Hsp20/alpha crystallin family protein n=1 Tax=Paucibacter sp. PLA-PC-4 TaxID=2993655 RepID=UPI00224985C1|nr:Hsp20/alpha crystallin family protein [Paucibacter sp. PLA-PC-4]MCX2861839.1 Hsp20/alpha crystallin family protein [Paucibacter sp. PLA-PC-4]
MFVIPVSRHSADLSRHIERLFNTDQDAVALRSPALDVSETDAAYTLQLDLPGVAKEAVKIKIEGRRVSIDAEQTRAAEKAAGERVLYRERSVTRFSRTLALPQELNKSDSTAKLDNGVLTLTLVKRQPDNAGELSVS